MNDWRATFARRLSVLAGIFVAWVGVVEARLVSRWATDVVIVDALVTEEAATAERYAAHLARSGATLTDSRDNASEQQETGT